VSVVIDRLGYGRSDKPAGSGSCFGGQADIAHQIVQQLRSGRYDGVVSPRFRRIALAGHSAGGLTAETEAFSFADVDAIAVIAYADQPLTPVAQVAADEAAAICARGGQPVYGTTGPAGYALLGQTVNEAFSGFFSSVKRWCSGACSRS